MKYEIKRMEQENGTEGDKEMDFYKRALELNEDTIENRRYFHQTAEVGLDMPKAQSYILEKLKEYGLSPERCGHGVTAMLATEARCFF